MQALQYQIDVDTEQNLLRATVQGLLNSQDVIALYQVFTFIGNTHKITRLLLDFCQSDLAYSSASVVDVSHRLADLIKDFKVARVINSGDYRQTMIEQVFSQLDVQLRNFEDRDAGIIWLLDEN